jgi:hypothetical protein
MFGESTKETLLWIVGMLFAAGITIVGLIWVVNNVIAPRDRTDPLMTKGGLSKDQGVQGKPRMQAP